MSAHDANLALDGWLQLFRLTLDDQQMFAEWRSLVSVVGVTGRAAHDARLVAAMLQHGINELLTYNPQDFKRYNGITVDIPGHAT